MLEQETKKHVIMKVKLWILLFGELAASKLPKLDDMKKCMGKWFLISASDTAKCTLKQVILIDFEKAETIK